jgi:peptidoglycan/LPS O-acetylase OafA/YrhL
LGKISYGFSIFHFPVLWIAYTITGSPRGTFSPFNLTVTIGAFIATWIVSDLSFRFVESPFLRMKKRFVVTGDSSPGLREATDNI